MKRKNNALTRVRKHFPNVNFVKDAGKGLLITVLEKDSTKSRKKDPENCALAMACKRQKIADHALIGISFSWLIKGDTATRYKTSNAVQREIVSFDRHRDFASGDNYSLLPVPHGQKLGKSGPSWHGPRLTKKKWPRRIHHTANIRSLK